MKIVVRLYGALRRYRPADAPGEPHTSFPQVLQSGTTIDMLSGLLGIPDGLAGVAAVNDEAVDGSTILKDGDNVSFFPPSAGGAAANQV
jgi:molybdopterin converting factor small subunit